MHAAFSQIIEELSGNYDFDMIIALLALPDVVEGLAAMLDDSPTYRKVKESPKWIEWEKGC